MSAWSSRTALLPHRTVLENAAFGLEVQKVDKAKRPETAKAALAKVGLADWGNRFPTSCRAACSSAWASPAHSPPIPRSS